MTVFTKICILKVYDIQMISREFLGLKSAKKYDSDITYYKFLHLIKIHWCTKHTIFFMTITNQFYA